MVPYLRAIVVWLIIMCAETIHGIARGILLVPLVGDLAARQIGVGVGSLLIFLITLITVSWMKTTGIAQRIAIGMVWVILTAAFEFLLGHCVIGLSMDRIFSDYDVTRGGLMIFGLLIMMLSPSFAYYLRQQKTSI